MDKNSWKYIYIYLDNSYVYMDTFCFQLIPIDEFEGSVYMSS